MKKKTIQPIYYLLICIGWLTQTTCYGEEKPASGFYKDVFMSGGVRLSSRKVLPAAESLKLSYEYYAGKDAEKQS